MKVGLHGECRGHNGKVRSLAWLPDDTKLVSAGVDGAVYEWRLKDFKRTKENVLKVRIGGVSLPMQFQLFNKCSILGVLLCHMVCYV